MGKFLRDAEGQMVAIAGAPVLEKSLDRNPRDCQNCGFCKWAKGDKLFILAGNQWYCPDCAVAQGLPPQYYHRNAYATVPPPVGATSTTTGPTPRKAAGVNNASAGRQSGLGELMACMCYF